MNVFRTHHIVATFPSYNPRLRGKILDKTLPTPLGDPGFIIDSYIHGYQRIAIVNANTATKPISLAKT
jgi:hypothetical protein